MNFERRKRHEILRKNILRISCGTDALNIGSGVGQILHGSVCLRMQCSVGTKHMPESTAIFTILI